MAHPIELILTRELAAHLSTPVFLVDLQGTLLYYNEAAEPLLGARFDERGPMPVAEWSATFAVRHENGSAILDGERPLVTALRDPRPGHQRLVVTGADGVDRVLDVTAIPLQGQGGRALGAIALFWSAM